MKLSKVGVIAYLSLKTPTELKSLAEAYVKNSDALASRCIIIPSYTILYQLLLTAILSARLFYTVTSAFTFSFLSLLLLLSSTNFGRLFILSNQVIILFIFVNDVLDAHF